MTWRCGLLARDHMHGGADAEAAEIVAVCSIDPTRAGDFARNFGARP